MVSDAKTKPKSNGSGVGGGGAGAGAGGGGGFRGRMENYLYSGDKKHVMVGLGIISLAFGIPWFLMNRETKHQSHQDYMEKADKARRARLSPSSAK